MTLSSGFDTSQDQGCTRLDAEPKHVDLNILDMIPFTGDRFCLFQ